MDIYTFATADITTMQTFEIADNERKVNIIIIIIIIGCVSQIKSTLQHPRTIFNHNHHYLVAYFSITS